MMMKKVLDTEYLNNTTGVSSAKTGSLYFEANFVWYHEAVQSRTVTRVREPRGSAYPTQSQHIASGIV